MGLTDFRIARYKLRHRQQEAAGAPLTPEQQPSAPASYVETHAPHTPVRITPPTIDGPDRFSVNGVGWTAPAGSRVFPSVTGSQGGVYVLDSITGELHCLRTVGGRVEEVQLPAALVPEIRKRLRIDT